MSDRNEQPEGVRFAPHPGKITHHYKWNNSDEVENANEVPDSAKFIYYDDAGQQTSDTTHATRRVPIIEVDIISMDKNGKLVRPDHAIGFSMTEFGPGHRQLRHTTGSAPGK